MAIKAVLYKILTESAASGGHQNLIGIRDKLCESQVKIQKQTFVQILLYVVYAIAPPLWLSYDYMLPISWFTPPLIMLNVINTLYDDKAKDPVSQGGLSRQRTHSEQRKPFEEQQAGDGVRRDMKNDPTQYTSFAGEATVLEMQDENDVMLLTTGTTWAQMKTLRTGSTKTPTGTSQSTALVMNSSEDE